MRVFGKTLKTELKKAVWNRKMLAVMVLVLGLVAVHCVMTVRDYWSFYEYYQENSSENLMVTGNSLFNHWLGADLVFFPATAFFFLLPILAALPYGWSLVTEIRSGYVRNVLSRTSRKAYFVSKYAADFIAGALVIVVPLSVSVLVLALFLPAIPMEYAYPYGTISQPCMWAELYFSHPYLYCILYILLDGIYAGLIASLSTALAFFFKNRVAVVLSPFLLLLLADYVDSGFLTDGEYSPMKFLHALPLDNDCYGWAVFLIGAALFIMTAGVTWYGQKHFESL